MKDECGTMMRLVLVLCAGSFLAPAHAEEALRVVPQVPWPAVGHASPDGSMFASSVGQMRSVCLVSREGVLLWALPLWRPRDTAFSNDERWLAACGVEEGLLLDLKSCELRRLPALRGQVVVFADNSEKVLVARSPAVFSRTNDPENAGLFVCDLGGRQLAKYPVAMDVPGVVEILPDGKTVRVRGAHGNPGSRLTCMGKAEETIHLDTGKTERNWGPLEPGWSGSIEDPRRVNLPPPGEKTLRQRPEGLYWSETSGLCVQYGGGMPEGGVTKAWDIRRGRFLHTLGTGNRISRIGGFLGPDEILAVESGRKPCLSLVSARSATRSSIGLAATWSSPGPDGASLLITTEAGRNRSRRLELYRLAPVQRVYSETGDEHHVPSSAWSRDGRYVAIARPRSAGLAARVVSVADGKVEETSFADVPVNEPTKSRIPPRVWSLDLDDSGQWLAAGIGEPHSGLVAIASRTAQRVEAVLEGFPIWASALRFVGPDRLLTGTPRGCVQLWQLPERRPLWTTETGQEVLQFGYVPGGPYLVCGHRSRSGSVLRLEDGTVIDSTRRPLPGGSSMPFPWTQPQLIGDGTKALEMDPEAMQLRLVDVSTGQTLLTYCGLPDGQWMIYTPAGDWDGSERVHEWVRFCRGFQPLPPESAERWHRRERIDSLLDGVFSRRSSQAKTH